MSYYGRLAGLLAIAVLTLNACGIKPSSLQAPDGGKQDTFPRSYPSDPED